VPAVELSPTARRSTGPSVIPGNTLPSAALRLGGPAPNPPHRRFLSLSASSSQTGPESWVPHKSRVGWSVSPPVLALDSHDSALRQHFGQQRSKQMVRFGPTQSFDSAFRQRPARHALSSRPARTIHFVESTAHQSPSTKPPKLRCQAGFERPG
jgi:hypothetical protein